MSNHIDISPLAVRNGIWNIQRYLMLRYGSDIAECDVAPLKWWCYTGRASCDFLRAMLTAKPFMIARRLHKGGSWDEMVARVREFLGE